MNGPRIRKLGQALTAISAGVIAYATLAPNISAGDTNATLAHFLLFLPLGAGSALWMALLPATTQKRVGVILLAIILIFAAATELAQGPIEGRTPSLNDWFADAAGGALGILLGRLVASQIVHQR